VKEPMYKFIDIHDIEANEKQPRTHFEKEKIQELSVSIQQNGLLQPIVVRPYNGKYQIVVGERRFRACKLAGLEEVPCMVQEYNEDQTATAALVENIQRENLSPIEEALAYQQLLDTQDITQEQLAEKLSLSARYISQLERGIAFGSATTITNICKALNITSDFLFYDLIKSNSPIMNDLIDENFLEDYLKLDNYNKVIVNSITKELVKLQKENFEINKQYKKA
jgi:ParB/RepB/Spo0J family partition protein